MRGVPTRVFRPGGRIAWALALAAGCAGCAGGPDLFEDAAARAGLRFESYSGDHLWYIIDTMGSGVALGDIDGDGDADIFLMGGSAITDSFQAEAARHHDVLWRNDGQGRFSDVTEGAGVGRSGWSNGAAFGDYDGDGDLDLYVARTGTNLLYRNDGQGRFSEVAAAAGVDSSGWSSGVVWGDFDRDGDLDLYVANYVIYDIEKEKGRVRWFDDGPTQFPQHFTRQGNILYRNNGDGTFSDITDAANARGSGRSLGVVATDYDDDGDLDLFIANDVGFNDLLRNDGGRFTNVGFEAGVAADESGKFQAGMGVAAGDYDNDGRIDLLVTNYAGELNTLYHNEGGGLFTDVTRRSGLDDQRILDSVGWGAGFQDFDLDGNLDLLVVNGHILGDMVLWYMRHFGTTRKDDIPQMRRESYNAGADQSKLLFLGRGDGTFLDATDGTGRTFRRKRVGRGAAFADLDGDGRVDLVVVNKNEPAQILLNRMAPRGNWLELELRGRPPNGFAVGARARVFAGGRVLTREVHAGSSYLSGDDIVLHFGLGEAQVERVEVRWPDGAQSVHGGLEVNRRHLLREEEPPALPTPAAVAPVEVPPGRFPRLPAAASSG